MTEEQDKLEQLYAAVIRSVKNDGYTTPTAPDVAEVHSSLKTGSSPSGQVAWAIACHLREHLPARNLEEGS